MTKKKTGMKKTTRKAGQKRPVPGWIIMVGGILFGLLLATFVYIKGWVPQPIVRPSEPMPSQLEEKPVEDVSKTVEKKKADYDFYTVLPEMEVVIPKEELQQHEVRDDQSYQFILQVASFKSQQDAEQLKAQIAFSGQIAYIQSIEVNGTQWHRVRVGPFDSGREADKQKRALEKGGHRALILKETKE